MHPIQQKLLKLAETKHLGQMTLREIGDLIGEKYPQKIKHHLSQLEKKGFIRIDKQRGLIQKNTAGKIENSKIISVPILGTANCGPATFYTETNYDGYLKVSSKLLDRKKDVYALRADGISMNKANVKGKNIEEGDYLIVNSADTTPADNDIVVSVFDDVANIKKFKWDQENNQVVLLSESTRDFPPIFIHEDDNYHIVGKVIQVIKKPSFK
jgi:repressor LexA